MVIYGDWKLIKNNKIDIFNQSMHLHPIDKSLIPLAILFALSHHLGKCIQWETSINQYLCVDPLHLKA